MNHLLLRKASTERDELGKAATVQTEPFFVRLTDFFGDRRHGTDINAAFRHGEERRRSDDGDAAGILTLLFGVVVDEGGGDDGGGWKR